MRLSADLKMLDKTFYLNATYCICRSHHDALDLPWGRRKENKYTAGQGKRTADNLFLTKNAQSKNKLIASSIKHTKYISEIRSRSERETKSQGGGSSFLTSTLRRSVLGKIEGIKDSCHCKLTLMQLFFFLPPLLLLLPPSVPVKRFKEKEILWKRKKIRLLMNKEINLGEWKVVLTSQVSPGSVASPRLSLVPSIPSAWVRLEAQPSGFCREKFLINICKVNYFISSSAFCLSALKYCPFAMHISSSNTILQHRYPLQLAPRSRPRDVIHFHQKSQPENATWFHPATVILSTLFVSDQILKVLTNPKTHFSFLRRVCLLLLRCRIRDELQSK